MKTINEVSPTYKIVLFQEGTGGRRVWWYQDNFLHTISEVLLRGSKSQSDLYLFCPETGKNIGLTLVDQRTHSKLCKGNVGASLSYMQTIANTLGIEWHPLFTQWVQLKVEKKNTWEALHSIQAQWKELQSAQVKNIAEDV